MKQCNCLREKNPEQIQNCYPLFNKSLLVKFLIVTMHPQNVYFHCSNKKKISTFVQ